MLCILFYVTGTQIIGKIGYIYQVTSIELLLCQVHRHTVTIVPQINPVLPTGATGDRPVISSFYLCLN